jgi:hypothetical protein
MEVKKDVVDNADVDMNATGRDVWLIKVPRFISRRWEKCPKDVVAGHINISMPKYGTLVLLLLTLVNWFILNVSFFRDADQGHELNLSLSDVVLKNSEGSIPKAYALVPSSGCYDNLDVFSQLSSIHFYLFPYFQQPVI